MSTGSLAPGVLLDSMGSAEGLTLALEASTTEPEIGRRGYSQGVVEVERPVPYVFGGFPTSGASVEWFRALFGRAVAHAQLIAEADADLLRQAWLTATRARNALVLVRGKPTDQLPGPGRLLNAVAVAAGWPNSS